MAYSYNIAEAPVEEAPCPDYDVQQAKKFLQKHSPESGDCLYDHLTELLTKILAERPNNAVDVFEEYSRKVKEERFRSEAGHLQDQYVPPPQYEEAKRLINLFQSVHRNGNLVDDQIVDSDTEDAVSREKQLPNMLELLFFFEQADIGLPRSEMVLLNLAIRKLASEVQLKNIRFWGKILGKPKDYYVLEAELTEENLNRRLQDIAAKEELGRESGEGEVPVSMTESKDIGKSIEAIKLPDDESNDTEQLSNFVVPPLPTASWNKTVDVPAEKLGSGVNQKVYFVCNTPGLDEWVELPAVTPQQIVAARQIVRYCTGNLENPIHTFPPFPGTEKNYLRAQIARISGATHVSPVGFFTFGGGEEEEEEEIEEEKAETGELWENTEYEPLTMRDLIDPSMTNWCHHTAYILKQGRTLWWNPEKPEEDLDEESAEEEEEEDAVKETGQFEKEVGPPLLTPLSEDAIQESIAPWTALQSSYAQSDTAIAIIRSNMWPGAFAFASGKRFANVYIGTGHKHTAFNYSPPNMPTTLDQYPIGPEVMEIRDPTAEEEEAYRISQLPPEPIAMDEEDEEDLETDEEEDDEEID